MSSVYIRFPVPVEPAAAGAPREPLLERLLARAVVRAEAPDWRAAAYTLLGPGDASMPAVAPIALRAAQVDGTSSAAAASVFLAAPLHCEAGMSSVTLPADGMVGLEAPAAAQLALEFNRVFGGTEQRLVAAASGRLFCVFDADTQAETQDPAAALGRDIGGFLPRGRDAARLKRLMSEIEMWLFEHPFNRARLAAGAKPVTGLWLWGGGAPVPRLPVLSGWTAGADPFFGAWPAPQEFPARAGGGPGAGVVAIASSPGSDAWRPAEVRWIAPALAALRAGAIRNLCLSAGELRFELRRRSTWRLWRRPRPWWEYWS